MVAPGSVLARGTLRRPNTSSSSSNNTNPARKNSLFRRNPSYRATDETHSGRCNHTKQLPPLPPPSSLLEGRRRLRRSVSADFLTTLQAPGPAPTRTGLSRTESRLDMDATGRRFQCGPLDRDGCAASFNAAAAASAAAASRPSTATSAHSSTPNRRPRAPHQFKQTLRPPPPIDTQLSNAGARKKLNSPKHRAKGRSHVRAFASDVNRGFDIVVERATQWRAAARERREARRKALDALRSPSSAQQEKRGVEISLPLVVEKLPLTFAQQRAVDELAAEHERRAHESSTDSANHTLYWEDEDAAFLGPQVRKHKPLPEVPASTRPTALLNRFQSALHRARSTDSAFSFACQGVPFDLDPQQASHSRDTSVTPPSPPTPRNEDELEWRRRQHLQLPGLESGAGDRLSYVGMDLTTLLLPESLQGSSGRDSRRLSRYSDPGNPHFHSQEQLSHTHTVELHSPAIAAQATWHRATLVGDHSPSPTFSEFEDARHQHIPDSPSSVYTSLTTSTERWRQKAAADMERPAVPRIPGHFLGAGQDEGLKRDSEFYGFYDEVLASPMRRFGSVSMRKTRMERGTE